MSPRCLLSTVALALLAGGVVTGWVHEQAAREPSVEASKRELAPVLLPPEKPIRLTDRTRVETVTPRALSSVEATTLSIESSAAVAEQAALQLLAKGAELELTAEQWATLADVTLNFQAVRQAYEATIARATLIKAGCYRLEIPAYPVAGDALREKFQTELRERLGAAVADEIATRMGSALEGHFAGFGVGVQTLDFTADASGAENEYQVTRTVQFWNSFDASNRLTTRRETHFPGIEDPSGYTWGPFLSVLAGHIAAKTGS